MSLREVLVDRAVVIAAYQQLLVRGHRPRDELALEWLKQKYVSANGQIVGPVDEWFVGQVRRAWRLMRASRTLCRTI